MTIADVKKQVYGLIEELNTESTNLTSDPDLAAKMNYVINQVQIDLAQIKKISAKTTFTYTTTYEFDLPSDFYKVKSVNCIYERYGNKIVFDTEETVIDFYYYKFPAIITSATADTVALELSLDCLNAMVYGIASDLLKSDVSVDYTVYASRYAELKNQLSDSSPMVWVGSSEEIEYW